MAEFETSPEKVASHFMSFGTSSNLINSNIMSLNLACLDLITLPPDYSSIIDLTRGVGFSTLKTRV